MRLASFVAALLAAAGLCGCAPAGPQVDTAADVAAIEKLYPAWVETTRSRDLEAFASFLAPGAHFQPPDHPALQSRQEIMEFYRKLYEDPQFALNCRQQQVEVAASGDMAWSRDLRRHFYGTGRSSRPNEKQMAEGVAEAAQRRMEVSC